MKVGTEARSSGPSAHRKVKVATEDEIKKGE